MTFKKIIVSVLIFSSSFIAGKYAWEYFFGVKEVHSFSESDWRLFSPPNFKLTIETPLELEKTNITIPWELKNKIVSMETYQNETDPFALALSFAVFKDGVETNLQGAAEGAVLNLKSTISHPSFDYQILDTKRKNFPGKIIKGTFEMKGKDAAFYGEIYVSTNKLWQVLSIYIENEKNHKVKERVMRSIRFN